MPNDIIRQANNLIPSAVGHGRKTLRIGLILKGVAGEVYTYISQDSQGTVASNQRFMGGIEFRQVTNRICERKL